MKAAFNIVDLINLTCCCCGRITKGRQWHNLNRGHGLCNGCLALCSQKCNSADMLSNYGVDGINYNIKPEPSNAGAIENHLADAFFSIFESVPT